MKELAMVGLLTLTAATAHADALRIGVTPGALADSVIVAAEEAQQLGIDVEVVEFSDWTTPNLALANGDLDANYFQHQAFLDNAVEERRYPIESIAFGILPNVGLYSQRIESLDDLQDGARVAVASDPVNQGRGLQLLQSAGLIELDPNAGAKANLDSVIANPKALRLIEIEGPQLVRAINDVDLAQGYPSHIVAAEAFDPGSALLFSGLEDEYYAIRFVAHHDNTGNEKLLEFIDLYQHSPAVREQIHRSNANDDRLYSLPWLNH
ncbi:MetQ/NlpA family ABC transporter substrate-binding protein [Halomonas sp. AOP35-4E-18]|uniref:MetQ/NlpA family ABC transporter substrate-binding protein n=1 Tax=Halomonas sp. AOP35-4E-18 TaxID=3457686 RepID=UPI004034B8D8